MDRLEKRAWLIQNLNYILDQANFYRLHKRTNENLFNLPVHTILLLGEEEGFTEIQ